MARIAGAVAPGLPHHVTQRGNGRLKEFPLGGVSEEEIERIRRHERTGRPLGNDGFVGKLEETLGRILQCHKPGRKRGHKQK